MLPPVRSLDVGTSKPVDASGVTLSELESYSKVVYFTTKRSNLGMQSVVNASVKMSPTLRERIQNLAKVRKQSAHAVMLQALETFVSREERREAWRQEGIAAWEEYKQTGLHLTQEELESWANNISQGERTPMPKCHM